MKQYLSLVLPIFALCNHGVLAKIETFDLGNDITGSWEVNGPCIDGTGDAFATDHQICFKSDVGETYTLTFDLGGTPFTIPVYIGPGGSTCTTQGFDTAGEYKCDLTVSVGDQTETVSFNNPWVIDDLGICGAGMNSEPEPAPAPSDVVPLDETPEVNQAQATVADEKSGAAFGCGNVEVLLFSIFSLLGSFVVM